MNVPYCQLPKLFRIGRENILENFDECICRVCGTWLKWLVTLQIRNLEISVIAVYRCEKMLYSIYPINLNYLSWDHRVHTSSAVYCELAVIFLMALEHVHSNGYILFWIKSCTSPTLVENISDPVYLTHSWGRGDAIIPFPRIFMRNWMQVIWPKFELSLSISCQLINTLLALPLINSSIYYL